MPSIQAIAIENLMRKFLQPAIGERTILEQRESMERPIRLIKFPSWLSVEPVDAGGVSAEWISGRNLIPGRAILYLHGGGWVAGSIVTHRWLAAGISSATRARVLLIDYRLAPENRFPAALDDCLAAYQWLLRQGFQPEKIGLSGDSAGGNLTLALLLRLRNSNQPLPAAAALLSPATDLTGEREGLVEQAAIDPMLNLQSGQVWVEAYLVDHDPHDPYVSPLLADLHGLPPLLFQVGSDEMLLEDSHQFYEKARAAGVDVTLEVWPGMWHVWQALAPFLPEASQAIRGIGEFFNEWM